MSGNQNNQSAIKITYKGLGLALGLVLGGLVGILIDNMIIFAGGGMVIGLAIGAALDQRSIKKNS
jgi:F0F1-type ATP synthase assembly protein I